MKNRRKTAAAAAAAVVAMAIAIGQNVTNKHRMLEPIALRPF